tara:strand:- start:1569 stop:2510 length:942 start_codon:yes stop_codon:yes gene_type:complete
MNKIFKIFFIIFFLTLSNNHISFSSIKNNIIAKVGNEIITLIELENKVNTTLILTNQKINQENINKLKNISLKRLIDLKIKQSEIKRFNLTLNEIAIENHMLKVSNNLNINSSELKKFFELRKINYEQYKKEVEIEFLWQKLIAELYSSKIDLDKDQIEKEILEFSKNKEKISEFKLAELEINYEIDTKNELVKEIKNSIEKIGFSKTVTKYSISTSALNGGEIGWVNSKAISSNLIDKIKNLKIGEISSEIVGPETLVFYKMVDKRFTKDAEETDINKIREKIINRKKSELLNLYSNSHLSKKKNNTFIKLQ